MPRFVVVELEHRYVEYTVEAKDADEARELIEASENAREEYNGLLLDRTTTEIEGVYPECPECHGKGGPCPVCHGCGYGDEEGDV